jgi:hypothetical protein
VTILDGVVFIGLLIIVDEKHRPKAFVGMLLVTLAFMFFGS